MWSACDLSPLWIAAEPRWRHRDQPLSWKFHRRSAPIQSGDKSPHSSIVPQPHAPSSSLRLCSANLQSHRILRRFFTPSPVVLPLNGGSGKLDPCAVFENGFDRGFHGFHGWIGFDGRRSKSHALLRHSSSVPSVKFVARRRSHRRLRGDVLSCDLSLRSSVVLPAREAGRAIEVKCPFALQWRDFLFLCAGFRRRRFGRTAEARRSWRGSQRAFWHPSLRASALSEGSSRSG